MIVFGFVCHCICYENEIGWFWKSKKLDGIGFCKFICLILEKSPDKLLIDLRCNIQFKCFTQSNIEVREIPC